MVQAATSPTTTRSPRSSTSEDTPPTCEYCGRELLTRTIPLFGGMVHTYYGPCDCPEATEARQAAELEKERAEEMAKLERFMHRCTAAGIGKRYLNATLSDEIKDAYEHREKEGLYITGPVGTGKTYQAMALAEKLIKEKQTVRVISAMELLAQFRAVNNGEDTEEEILGRLNRPKVLIIDDLGKNAPTEWVLSMLYQVIDQRYKDMSTIIVTSNYDKSDLYNRLKREEPATAKALVSRLWEMTDTVEMSGKDRRIA